jgi:hypothetical protein
VRLVLFPAPPAQTVVPQLPQFVVLSWPLFASETATEEVPAGLAGPKL